MDRDELAALAGRLEAWSGFIASGYECPAAGQVMLQASRALREIGDENARLTGAIKETIAAADYTPDDGEWENGYAWGKAAMADMLEEALSPNPDQQED